MQTSGERAFQAEGTTQKPLLWVKLCLPNDVLKS